MRWSRGLEYEVTSQELCLVPAEMPHRCNYQGELLVINLSESILDNRDAAVLSYPTVISMRGQIVHLVELIQMELNHDLDVSQILCKHRRAVKNRAKINYWGGGLSATP